jgi:hypothetical protein
MSFWLVFILVLNFGISWLNAWACGKAWAETKSFGGWRHFMNWMGAIMSASGFSWCYLFVLVGIGYATGFLPVYWSKIAIELGYVIIIPGILFSGLMIMIDSWATAYREGGVLNYGVAGWNTYAQIHNTMSAISSFGQALGDVIGAFGGKRGSSSSDEDSGKAVVVLLVLVAILAGAMTTIVIIKRTAAQAPLKSWAELEAARKAREE